MKMRRSIRFAATAILGFSLIAACSVCAIAADDENEPPPPASIDQNGVDAWLARYIKTDGWVVIWENRDAVTLGGPSGVALQPDNSLQAEIRHEYYVAITLDGIPMRSNRQIWRVDCKAGLFRVIAIDLYALSNLKGEHQHFEMANVRWRAPSQGSLDFYTMDRICRATTEGRPRN
jgi:hypothetical protein